jgi:uncharacterized protein
MFRPVIVSSDAIQDRRRRINKYISQLRYPNHFLKTLTPVIDDLIDEIPPLKNTSNTEFKLQETTPLIEAIVFNKNNINSFTDNRENLNQQDKNKRTPLMIAASDDDLETLYLLVQKKCDLNLQDDNGNTALHQSGLNGHALAVKLLATQAELNLQNKDGMTPLMNAASNGYHDCVDILLQSGANPDIINYKGETALILAAKNIPLLITVIEEMLSEEVMKPGMAENEINHIKQVLSYNLAICIQYLLNFNVNPDHQDQCGKTALMYAVQNKNSTVVRILLEKNANTEIMSHEKKTALDYAIDQENFNAISLLLNFNAVVKNISSLETIIYKLPEGPDYYFGLGIVNSMRNEYKITNYNRAIHDTVLPAIRKLGEMHEKNKNTTLAEECYMKALQVNDKLVISNFTNTAMKIVSDGNNINKYLKITAIIYQALISYDMNTVLTHDQWSFLAADALGNPYFKSFKEAIIFALRALKAAIDIAQRQEPCYFFATSIEYNPKNIFDTFPYQINATYIRSEKNLYYVNLKYREFVTLPLTTKELTLLDTKMTVFSIKEKPIQLTLPALETIEKMTHGYQHQNKCYNETQAHLCALKGIFKQIVAVEQTPNISYFRITPQ